MTHEDDRHSKEGIEEGAMTAVSNLMDEVFLLVKKIPLKISWRGDFQYKIL